MAQAPAMAPAIKTTLRPLHDRVLVKRLEKQDDTLAGAADESKASAATGHAVN